MFDTVVDPLREGVRGELKDSAGFFVADCNAAIGVMPTLTRREHTRGMPSALLHHGDVRMLRMGRAIC
jgi:hypothetical protein